MTGPTYEYILPVDMNLGFPQVVFTEIAGKFFGFTYRFNHYDDSLILKWVTASGKIVWMGKLVVEYMYEVKDPDYGIVFFLIVPDVVDKKNIVLSVYAPWL